MGFAKSYIRRGATYKRWGKVKKHFGDMMQNSDKAALALLVLGILFSAFTLIPIAKASDLVIDLTPTQGPPGTAARVYGVGFASGAVTISFNSKDVSRTSTGMFGRINGGFIVPSVPTGAYAVVATDSAGNRATATFTVTQKGSTSSPSNSPSSGIQTTASITLSSTIGSAGTGVSVSGSGFNSGASVSINFGTTYVAGATADGSGLISSSFKVPFVSAGTYGVSASDAQGKYASAQFTVTQAGSATGIGQNSGSTQDENSFWSPTAIAITAIAVSAVIIVPIMLIRRRRGKQETLLDEERPLYQPKMPPKTPSPSTKYYPTSQYGQNRTTGYNQPTSYNRVSSYGVAARRSTMAASYNQPRRYSLPTANLKTCPHCKQLVKADYSICPSCKRRLR
jgi:hypothetical protein